MGINFGGWSCRDLRCTVSGEEVALSTCSLEAPVSGGQAERACHTPCLRGRLGANGVLQPGDAGTEGRGHRNRVI